MILFIWLCVVNLPSIRYINRPTIAQKKRTQPKIFLFRTKTELSMVMVPCITYIQSAFIAAMHEAAEKSIEIFILIAFCLRKKHETLLYQNSSLFFFREGLAFIYYSKFISFEGNRLTNAKKKKKYRKKLCECVERLTQ